MTSTLRTRSSASAGRAAASVASKSARGRKPVLARYAIEFRPAARRLYRELPKALRRALAPLPGSTPSASTLFPTAEARSRNEEVFFSPISAHANTATASSTRSTPPYRSFRWRPSEDCRRSVPVESRRTLSTSKLSHKPRGSEDHQQDGTSSKRSSDLERMGTMECTNVIAFVTPAAQLVRRPLLVQRKPKETLRWVPSVVIPTLRGARGEARRFSFRR